MNEIGAIRLHTFDELAAKCRESPVSPEYVRDEPSLSEWATCEGEPPSRVFGVMVLVQRKSGRLRWYAAFCASVDGEIGSELLPLADWNPEHHLAFCELRLKFLALSPGAKVKTESGPFAHAMKLDEARRSSTKLRLRSLSRTSQRGSGVQATRHDDSQARNFDRCLGCGRYARDRVRKHSRCRCRLRAHQR